MSVDAKNSNRSGFCYLIQKKDKVKHSDFVAAKFKEISFCGFSLLLKQCDVRCSLAVLKLSVISLNL